MESESTRQALQQLQDHGKRRWPKGKSANHGAMPGRAPVIRAKARWLCEHALNILGDRMTEPGFAQHISVGFLLDVVKVLGPLGGYIRGDQLALAEAARWRVILAFLDAKNIDPAARDEILRTLMQRNDDTLGEPDTTENK